MNNKENTQIKPGSERNFGVVFSIFFLLIGVFSYYKSKDYSVYFFLISFIFVFFTIFFPKYLKSLNILWFRFGILLNSIVSPIIMLLIFFCVFLPIGLIMKVIKKDLINIKADIMLNSYWHNRKKQVNNMNKQF